MHHSMLHMEHKAMINIIALVWTWWKMRSKTNTGEGVLKVDEVVAMVGRRALECEEHCLQPTKTTQTMM